MRPSQFISYAERKLHRAVTEKERVAVSAARLESTGKREGVKAMRAALEAELTHGL
jgi:hypothetical protein